MKTKKTLFARLTSAVLAGFMLCSATAVNFGGIDASAEEYESGKSQKVDNIKIGDVFERGSVIYSETVFPTTYPEFTVLVNDEEIFYTHKDRWNNVERQLTVDRDLVLLKKEVASYDNKRMKLYFQEITQDGKVSSEDAMKTVLQSRDTVSLASDIVMKTPLTFDGEGKNFIINTNGHSISLASGQKGSVIIVKNNATLTINNANKNEMTTISGGEATYGGGIYVEKGKLYMTNVNVTGNKSNNNGAGVHISSSSYAELTDCTLENNSSRANGGGLYNNGTADLTNCTIENNGANDGGGIGNVGTITVTDCKVNGNTVGGGGAGIWSSGNATLVKSEFAKNINSINGGGITNHKDMRIAECTVSGNSVSNMGGGVFIDTDGKTVIDSNTIINANSAKTGGGIYLKKGDLTVGGATFMDNTATEAGGGLWANSGTTVSLSNVNMQKNSCKTNGGSLNSHGKVILKDSSIVYSTADNCGGGVYMDTNDTLTIENSEIANCKANKHGAGIYMHAGSLILTGGRIRITENYTNNSYDNIHFNEFKAIQVTGRLSSGSEIGVYPPTIKKQSNNTNNGNSGGNSSFVFRPISFIPFEFAPLQALSDEEVDPRVQEINITSGFGDHNDVHPSEYFLCDGNDYRINREEGLKDVKVTKWIRSSKKSYVVQVYIKVTDDADLWDYAHFFIYGKGNRGTGNEELLHKTGDFHESIDDGDESYSYNYDCGADYFPTAVQVQTSFGSWGTWRDFEADVTIYINGTNVASHHIVHKVYGDEEKNTTIRIDGNKYPYPDPESFETDARNEIEESGIVTLSAIDQYDVVWSINNQNATMENISFPGEDTYSSVDSNGLKWKVASTHRTDHVSTYELSFKSGSNIYPTITKRFNVRFIFPLTLSILVNDREVFEKKGYAGDKVQIAGIKTPPGYYITKYESNESHILTKNKVDKGEEQTYEFTFVNQSVNLNAVLKPNNYKIMFNKNGKDEKSTDVKGSVTNLTAYYGQEKQLSTNYLRRKGYTFVGWNTQADGRGTMYADKAIVKNLTDEKDAKVILYAIWKPAGASTLSSIFSDGTALIYVGIGVLLIAIITSIIYTARKKKQKQQIKDS